MAGRHSRLKRAEYVAPHRLKSEGTCGHRVESANTVIGETLGVGQGIENWQLHRRKPQLRQDAAIMKFGESVHHALGMHHDFESVVRQAEQVMRLDELERLVCQRSTVHRNLVPHPPGGMLQSFLHRCMPDPLGIPLPERASRRRQNQPRQVIVLAGDALQHRAVL